MKYYLPMQAHVLITNTECNKGVLACNKQLCRNKLILYMDTLRLFFLVHVVKYQATLCIYSLSGSTTRRRLMISSLPYPVLADSILSLQTSKFHHFI